MEIRVEADKQKSVKVKLQSDEVAVRVGKSVASDRLRPSVETLRAHFEESVTALRSHRSPSFPSVLPSAPSARPLDPSCPSISAFHPLLQTLLKLVWESYVHEFQSVTQTFSAGVTMKVKNTQRLLSFRKTLEQSSAALVAAMHDKAVQDVRTSFRATWADELAAAREALGCSSHDVDELLDVALKKASAATKVKPTDLHADVASCLGFMKQSFRVRSDRLWEEWTLQMKRHRLVFDGNLKELEFVDKQLAALKDPEPGLAATSSSTDADTAPDASPWKDLVLVLTSVKLDFDIQLGCLHKLKSWASESTEQSRASVLSTAFQDVLTAEETQLSDAKVQLSRSLEEQGIVRDRVLRELRTACNNTLAPVDSILKSMQLSFELSLEAAREHVYLRALHELKSVSQ
jgi:hypothetical protein